MKRKHTTQSPATEATARARHNQAHLAATIARKVLARLEAAENAALCDWMQTRCPRAAAILRGEGRA